MESGKANSEVVQCERALARSSVPGWLPLVALPLSAVAVRNVLPPWAFMWLMAFAIYAGLKWLTWWQSQWPVQKWRSFAYLLAWPGMDADTFLDSSHRPGPVPGPEWASAILKSASGACLLWIVARMILPAADLARGWVGMLGLILLLHFGTFHLLSLLWRSAGVNAQPIMVAPLSATSLAEFWGRRWNLGFRQLAYDLVFRPLHRKSGAVTASFLVFVVSGLIHEAVISLPARAGYGLPTMYFIIQGGGVMLERSSLGNKLGLQRGVRGWLYMAAFTAGPAFWLFHPPFVRNVILPFMQAIHAL